MLSLTTDAEGLLRFEMHHVSPSIYFDHWALRRISEQPDFRCEFLDLLGRANGTLCISYANVMEFTKIRHASTVRQTERFLDECYPHLFFIECHPWQVVENENSLIQGKQVIPPHGDLELLRVLPMLKPREGARPIAFDGFFEAAGEDLKERVASLGELFVKKIGELRERAAADERLNARVKQTPEGPGLQHCTRFLIPVALRPFVLDLKMQVAENDALDFLHAIVPVAYCDFALIDGRWATAAAQAGERLAKAGHVAAVARMFSERRGGIRRFLDALGRYGGTGE